MKRSNRKDDDILKTFSDDNMAMDATFKSKLKKDMLKYDAKLSKGKTAKRPTRAGRRFSWPKLVLAPAAVFAVAVIIGLAVFNGGQDNVVLPQKISAQQVATGAADYYQSADRDKYTLFIYESRNEVGPQISCTGEAGIGYGISAEQIAYSGYTVKNYTYFSSDDKVEAAYFATEVDGKILPRETNFFSTRSDGRLRQSYGFDTRKRELLPFDPYEKIGSKPVYVFVGATGKPHPADDLKTTRREGREVFVFYTKVDTSVMSTTCSDEITEHVYDAKTYMPLERNVYRGTVEPSHLVRAEKTSMQYLDVGQDEAIRLMKAGGFNESAATDELPLGGD